MATYWTPCICAGSSNWDSVEYAGNDVRNVGANDFYIRYDLPLPTNRSDGKKLYVSGVRVIVGTADSNNKITLDKVISFNGSSVYQVYLRSGDITTSGIHDNTFTNVDVSSKECVAVNLYGLVTNAAGLKILAVMLRVEYKT